MTIGWGGGERGMGGEDWRQELAKWQGSSPA